MAVTKEILALAVEIGDALLRNGAEVYRVEDTVMHILEAYEIENYDVYVLSNGIFASANEDREDACSMIRHIPLGTTHLGRIAALNQLSREICSHECSLIDAWNRLERCKNISFGKPVVHIFFCGLGCGCFSYLFGGTALDSIVGFFIGMLLQVFLFALKRHKNSKFITNILGSAFVTLLSLIVLSFGTPILYDKVIIGDIMPLVPGIALTTSIRDFFNGDYLSGAIHMIDAILTAFCIAVGRHRHYDLSFCYGRGCAVMIIQFIVSLFATLSFAELFGAPKKELFFCGLTGAIGWVVYVIGLNSNMGTVLANLTATFALTVFSRILSAIRRNPVTVYLIAGIFPLVPGAGIYYTSYYFIMNDMTQFSNYGMETIKVAGAIVLGIVFGFGLPQSWFNALQRIERKKTAL